MSQTLDFTTMTKGSSLDFTAETKQADGAKSITFGLGWDPIPGKNIDLDAVLLKLRNGKLASMDDRIQGTFNEKQAGVAHSGDNLTGEGDGDDESITVFADQLESDVDGVYLAVVGWNESFDGVEAIEANVYDGDSVEATKLANFPINEAGQANSALFLVGRADVVAGKLGKFEAIGEYVESGVGGEALNKLAGIVNA